MTLPFSLIWICSTLQQQVKNVPPLTCSLCNLGVSPALNYAGKYSQLHAFSGYLRWIFFGRPSFISSLACCWFDSCWLSFCYFSELRAGLFISHPFITQRCIFANKQFYSYKKLLFGVSAWPSEAFKGILLPMKPGLLVAIWQRIVTASRWHPAIKKVIHEHHGTQLLLSWFHTTPSLQIFTH